MAREITKVGVVGLGTMGAGIAEVFAKHGLDVVGFEIDAAGLERGRGHVENSTGRALKRGKITQEARDELLGHITFTTQWSDFAECDLVVEAVPEKMPLKHDVFTKLDAVVSPEAILATNTSSLSVTEISVVTSNPRRVLGMHFFNPAPVQRLVEVIRTVVTDADVVEDIAALARSLGKKPVVVGDKAGFIANALLLPYMNHAVAMYESNYASREDIDAAMHLGCGLPMGPLALWDLIGLDTGYEVLDTMYRQGRDRLHAPSPIIKQLVTAGLMGRKTGRGFYTYAEPGSGQVVPDTQTPHDSPVDTADLRTVSTVGVVGTGVMGPEIAEVFALGGYDVTLVARSDEKGAKARARIAQRLAKAVGRGYVSQDDADAALARITTTMSLDDLAGVDLVIDAISEELSAKLALFSNLDDICKPGAILATNTSSLSVIRLATATSRGRDVVGMHFFNPAPAMKLVEVVRTVMTAEDTVATVEQVARSIGKHPVACLDRAGFIVNTLLFPYLNNAIKMLEANYASVDDIDDAMKLGCGYPMGPFELLDNIGLDTALNIQRELYLEFREPGFAPAPLLEHLVKAGFLGVKTGRGFRTHT
ncbi:MAG: 3-hydroxyacyl-CoA dehydrogenase family protein [Actinomycetales bacterium]